MASCEGAVHMRRYGIGIEPDGIYDIAERLRVSTLQNAVKNAKFCKYTHRCIFDQKQISAS